MLGAPVFGAAMGQTASTLQGAGLPVATSGSARTVDEDKTAAFAGQVADDVGRTMLGALSYLGDRLGLYKQMADMDRFTAKDLASATGYNERLLEEWLRGMVSLQYVFYDSTEKRYSFRRNTRQSWLTKTHHSSRVEGSSTQFPQYLQLRT
jgi:hypothetical protein